MNRTVMGDSEGPVQIIEALEDHTFGLNDEALAKILQDPKVADKKVAVISVAGAFRKGKSFLLNFLLRYLQKKDVTEGDWLGVEDESLTGFSWRGGCERETSGILLWRQPFLFRLSNGEEIAVLLMDTQGAFDSQSIVKDCATVFALSAMISSLQIYNLSQNIQEDDLQHLQLFTEYGRLALDQTASKPFQSLLFLVRDWSYPYEAEYGYLGGQRILERRLQIEEEFKQQLRCLVPRLLAPEQLVLKKINGQTVTCRELMEYFRAYITIFQGEELPEPRSMLLATAEANNLAAVASAKALYCRQMDEICGGDSAFMATDDLAAEHDRCREESLDLFVSTKKMGGDEYSQAFLERLDTELNESYENYVKINNSKNLFKSFRTPAVLFVVLLLVYIFQEIFQFLSLETFAVTCSTSLGVILLTLCLWAYVRYSGALREVGEIIDELANFIWEHILSPASSYAMSEGVKKAASLQRKLSEVPSRGNFSTSSRLLTSSSVYNRHSKSTLRKEE